MKLLEVRTAIRRATKEDLFTGDVYNMLSKQGVKDNVTVFYLDQITKAIYGPRTIFDYSDFTDLYIRMQLGLVGIITPMPNVVTNEFLFDLVLREASIDDLKDTPRHIKMNRLYYTYADQKLLGPFYIDNSTTSLYLENLVAKNQIFVPNERQHFRKKEYKKTA
jgi:hypothetical protein